MLTDFDSLLNFDMDEDKRKVAVVKLLIDNNVMLKMILARLTRDENSDKVSLDFESKVADMYVKLMIETEKKDI